MARRKYLKDEEREKNVVTRQRGEITNKRGIEPEFRKGSFANRPGMDVAGERAIEWKGASSTQKNYLNTRFAESKGRIYPTFRFNRTGLGITSFSDTNYLQGNFWPAHDYRESGSTCLTGWDNVIDDTWKEGHRSGNMKDSVSGDVTAFKNNTAALFCLGMDLGYQNLYRELLANPTENDAAGGTAGANPVIGLHTLNSWNELVAELEARKIPVPTFISQLWSDLLLCFKIDDPWMRGTVQLPPRYYVPFMPDNTKTESESMMDTIYSNSGQSVVHMAKYDYKWKPFSKEMITNYHIYDLKGAEAVSWFMNGPGAHWTSYSGGQNYFRPIGSLSAATPAVTSKRLYFLSDANECAINYLLPMFEAYHATNNKYGGIMGAFTSAQAASYRCGLFQTSYTGTTFSAVDTQSGSADQVALLPLQMMAEGIYTEPVSRPVGGALTITGSYFSGAPGTDVDIDINPYGLLMGVKYGTGLSLERYETAFKQYLINNMF